MGSALSLITTVCLLSATQIVAWGSFAASEAPSSQVATGSPEDDHKSFFSYSPENPERQRGLFFAPIASVFLPGLDQWVEGQYRSATVYSSYAAVGAITFLGNKSGFSPSSNVNDILEARERRAEWGLLAYQDAGLLSAYHAFRTAAESRKPSGQFAFLKNDETSGDLLLAPLRFSLLLKPTVFVPLGFLAILSSPHGSADRERYVWRGRDLFFSSAISYNAGVGEEAFFHGYMMPALRESGLSDNWSNAATSLMFALAHLSPDDKVPWPQFVISLYLGWITTENDWTLSQSVFIHTWWDVIILSSSFASDSRASVYLPIVSLNY